MQTQTIDNRPWGHYVVLFDCESCKVKKIVVEPDQRLSYQYHEKRSEVWTVIQGVATVTLDDKKIIILPGYTISIPQGAKHRVQNDETEPLVFIEVQTGTYFGEDDIVRLEDDYDREV
tara:strand:- start:7219 stop:7572 length:354 start_codon:yes stop_codon:yes gene_type:complete